MIRDFFLFCAGIDTSLISGAEYSTERVRYSAIGALVFLTAVFAFVFTGFTVSTIAPGQPWIYIPAALLWASFVFCLDRYIVMSIRKPAISSPEASRRLWFVAAPRIVVAAFIGMLISHPFEMFVFNPEITKVLLRNEQARINMEKDRARQDLKNANAPLESQIQALRDTNKQRSAEDAQLSAQEDEAHKRANAAFDAVGREYNPTDLRVHYKNLNAQKAEKTIVARNAPRHQEIGEEIRLNNEKIRQFSAQLVSIPNLSQVEAVKRRTVFGLLDRLEAMHQLAREDLTLGVAMVFLTLFFMTIEIAPTMVKISSERGPYEDRLEQNELLARQKLQEQLQIERAGQEIRISEQESVLAEESRVRAAFLRDVLNSPEVELELERLRPEYAKIAARQIAQNLANGSAGSKRDLPGRPLGRASFLNQARSQMPRETPSRSDSPFSASTTSPPVDNNPANSHPTNPYVGNPNGGNPHSGDSHVAGPDTHSPHSTGRQFDADQLDEAMRNMSDPNIHTPHNNRPKKPSTYTPPANQRPGHENGTGAAPDLNQRIDDLLNGGPVTFG